MNKRQIKKALKRMGSHSRADITARYRHWCKKNKADKK